VGRSGSPYTSCLHYFCDVVMPSICWRQSSVKRMTTNEKGVGVLLSQVLAVCKPTGSLGLLVLWKLVDASPSHGKDLLFVVCHGVSVFT